MRDQHHRAACLDERPDIGEQLAGQDRIQRRGRLVEDDQLHLPVADREGARDLDHLPAGDGEVADDGVRVDAVPWKDRVELLQDQRRSLAPPAEAAERGMHDAGVLGDRKVRAQRKLLEYAADPVLAGRDDAVAPGDVGALDDDMAAVGPERSGQDVHQRRFAGAVVADQPDAAAGGDLEADIGKRPHRAETLRHAIEMDERLLRGLRHADE